MTWMTLSLSLSPHRFLLEHRRRRRLAAIVIQKFCRRLTAQLMFTKRRRELRLKAEVVWPQSERRGYSRRDVELFLTLPSFVLCFCFVFLFL